jgi:hypothetical protein
MSHLLDAIFNLLLKYVLLFPQQRTGLSTSINTKDELPTAFVFLGIIVYPAILGINLPCRFEILVEVHL